MNFDVKRTFGELIGKHVIHKKFPNELGIVKAEQTIRLQFDERGFILISGADTTWSVANGDAAVKTKPRSFIFDGPYLLMLLKKGAPWPYFAFWVENAELMVPAKPPGYGHEP